MIPSSQINISLQCHKPLLFPGSNLVVNYIHLQRFN